MLGTCVSDRVVCATGCATARSAQSTTTVFGYEIAPRARCGQCAVKAQLYRCHYTHLDFRLCGQTASLCATCSHISCVLHSIFCFIL